MNAESGQPAEPDLRVSVVPDPIDGVVTVQFNRKISWLSLAPADALALADEIRQKAEQLEAASDRRSNPES